MISVCLIAKNEAKNIEKCLKSFAKIVCELIVVDTGSTDATCDLARKYTDKIYHYQWDDDFSKARNFCISKASNDIVLTVDCDEYLDLEMSTSFDVIESIINADKSKVGRIVIKNIYTKQADKRESRERIGRLFSKSHYRYAGKIHEQLASIDEKSVSYVNIPVYLYHTGYDLDEEQTVIKSNRNEDLLMNELNEALKVDDKGVLPYIYYQLGKTRNMISDYKGALDWYSKALEYDVNPEQEYVKDLIECYGYMLLENELYERALDLEGIYESFAESADFLFLMGLVYMKNALFENSIAEFLKATEKEECKVQGVNSYRAFYNIAVIYECLGKIEEAVHYYELCGNYDLASKRLKLLK